MPIPTYLQEEATQNPQLVREDPPFSGQIKVYALVKTNLKTLVTTPQPLIQNQDFKELTLFDDF